MRKIRYRVAMSLDGYIAGPNGEYDWIVQDPEVNFAEIWSQFDTLFMGRRTYEPAIAARGKNAFKGMKTFVASHSLRQADHPQVTIVSEPSHDWMTTLRAQSNKDICLFGGGELFHSLLEMGGRHRRSKHRSDLVRRRNPAPSASGTHGQTEIIQPQGLPHRPGLPHLRGPALTANPDPSPGRSGTRCSSSPEPRCTKSSRQPPRSALQLNS